MCSYITVYDLEASALSKSQTASLDIAISRFFMNLFKTNSIKIVKLCQEYFALNYRVFYWLNIVWNNYTLVLSTVSLFWVLEYKICGNCLFDFDLCIYWCCFSSIVCIFSLLPRLLANVDFNLPNHKYSVARELQRTWSESENSATLLKHKNPTLWVNKLAIFPGFTRIWQVLQI